MDENETSSQNGEGAVDGRNANGSNGAKPKPKGPDPALSARNALLDDIDARLNAQRQAETQQVLEGNDENARSFLARARREQGDTLEEGLENAEDGGAADGSALDPEQGAATEQADTDGAGAPGEDDRAARSARAATAVTQEGDPLAEFVVVKNGKPMFRTKVDGREQLVPLEAARAQLQKHLAADLRLQDIAKQRRDLEARARNLQSAEAAFAVRSKSQPSGATPAVDDQALEREAAEVVTSLVNKPEAEAAKSLASVLKKVRQAATPQIDTSTIVQQAATLAVSAVAAQGEKKALTDGLAAFKRDFADIAADPDLYAMADRRTDAIAEEHPDWTPTQVMAEAGKQTRAWLAKKSGKPVLSQQPGNSGRQQRKDNLRPMPAARTTRVATAAQTETSSTPQDALAEIRKARGQPY